MTANVAVVGSGPAALASVWKLIERGVRPVVLDAGDQLPAATARLVHELQTTFGQWRPATVAAVVHNPTARGPSVPKKMVFGSDFLHGHNRSHSPMVNQSFIDPTFAKGGYTVGWGGAMLPIRGCDMRSWPINEADLAQGFAAVLARVPFSGQHDGLSSAFPLYGAEPDPLELTDQAREVALQLGRQARTDKFTSGQARVAIRATECRLCGLCLSGCPFGAIQTFDQYFDSLVKQDLIDYRRGIVVTRLIDTRDGVQVYAVDTENRPMPRMKFDRLFLAAGAIGSTRIALESMELFDKSVDMLDSQKFAVPLLVSKATKHAASTGNTLPAIFVDLRLPSTSRNWTHLQISSLNQYAVAAMRRRMQFGPLALHGLARPLVSRLMVGWAGLHSDHSDRFKLTLLRAHKAGRPILKLQSMPTPTTRQLADRTIAEIRRELLPAGILLLKPGAVIGPVGAGFHFGGSLPMRTRPEHALESDIEGRLACWQHVHVVDSSVFPSIPATTMVLTIMANAWRIAASADL